MEYRIYIVEDDMGIAQGVKGCLEGWGMQVCIVGDFRNVIEEFIEYQPHLILMDITLPFMGGYHWCQEIRRRSAVPILFLSSASDSMNIVMAVNLGADDFIAKPFDQSVLLAKVQAILRRTYGYGNVLPVIEHRGAALNTADGTLCFQGEKIEIGRAHV